MFVFFNNMLAFYAICSYIFLYFRNMFVLFSNLFIFLDSKIWIYIFNQFVRNIFKIFVVVGHCINVSYFIVLATVFSFLIQN